MSTFGALRARAHRRAARHRGHRAAGVADAEATRVSRDRVPRVGAVVSRRPGVPLCPQLPSSRARRGSRRGRRSPCLAARDLDELRAGARGLGLALAAEASTSRPRSSPPSRTRPGARVDARPRSPSTMAATRRPCHARAAERRRARRPAPLEGAAGHLRAAAGLAPDPAPPPGGFQAASRRRGVACCTSCPYRCRTGRPATRVRTQSVARCQAGVGLDPHVMARTGFPRSDPDAPGDDVVAGSPITASRLPSLRVPRPDADRVVRAPSRCSRSSAGGAPAGLQPPPGPGGARARPAAGIPVVYEVRGFWEESWASHSVPR